MSLWVHIQGTAGRMQMHPSTECAGQREILPTVIQNPCLTFSFAKRKPKHENTTLLLSHKTQICKGMKTKMCKSLQDTSPCEQTGKQISLMLLMLQRVTQESYLDVVCRCWRGCVCVCARAAAVVSRCLWEWPITRIRLVLYHRPARATVCTFPMKLTSFFSFLFFLSPTKATGGRCL